jgi:putative transcriptional regulator
MQIQERCGEPSACGRQTGKSKMPIVRRSRIDDETLNKSVDLAKKRQRTEAEIDAMAAEDGDALTDAELDEAVLVYPPPTAEQIRALLARLGLSQSQFALRFGFTIDTVQQYEQGRRTPSGPAATLLRVIAGDPEAVARALHPGRQKAL